MTEETKPKYGWGGRRPNQTGRPKKPEGPRKQHQIRAYEDEWELIRLFTKITRTHPAECKAFIEKYKQG